MDTPSTYPQRWLSEAAFVHRLARALVRDPDLAQDVAQDALAASLQQRPAPLDLRGWLAAVTRRLAGRAWRAHRERPAREAQVARPEADDREERTAQRLRLHRRLTDAVLALPEPYRTAVTLRYIDGLSPRAIARRCGVTAAAARQHVHRGLAMLRERLDAEFGDRRAWATAFVGLGLGSVTLAPSLWLLLPVIAMKKLVVAALVVVAFTVWALMPGEVAAPPAGESGAALAAATTETAPSATSPAATSAPAMRRGATAALVLDVVDDAAQPIAGADVRSWTEGGTVARQRTDDRGRATFAARDGAGGVLVQAAGRPPHLEALPAMTGEHRVVLPAGSVVAGLMLVDGVPAPAGVLLSLHGSAIAIPASAPKAIAELLAAWRPHTQAATGADGRFAFVGLAPDWRGSVKTPQTHWVLPQTGLAVADDDRSAQLDAPRADLVLATTKLPTVEGRVVWDDDGGPVAGPDITAWCRFADGDDSPVTWAASDAVGRFAVGFWPGSDSLRDRWREPAGRSRLQEVKLWVNAAGSAGAVDVTLGAERLSPPEEIVVRLRRAPVTHFLVVDAGGAPIRGARVQVARSETISEPTGADGRGTFTGPRDKVLVGAPGRMIVPATPRAPAAGTENDPLVFVLADDNALTLRLRTPSGSVPAARRVILYSTGGDLFAGRRFQSPFDREIGSSEASGSRKGKTQPDGTTAWYEWTNTVTVDEKGGAVLHSLEPGVACTAVLRDALEADLVKREFVTPAVGESLTLDLVVDATPRRLRGRVLDAGGRGIERAEIALGHERRRAYSYSRADGSFEQPALYGTAPLSVHVRARGFVPQMRDAVTGDDELVFRLETGRTVTVRVVDEGGELVPVNVSPELGALDAIRRESQVLQPGEIRWSELPAGVVTFACDLGGKRFEVKHDTAESAAVLRVPRPARIVVQAPPGWPAPKTGQTYLMALATRLDEPGEPGEPIQLALGQADDKADFLLPGRWRIALVLRTWRREPEPPLDAPQGPAEEVTLRAGELTRVQLR